MRLLPSSSEAPRTESRTKTTTTKKSSVRHTAPSVGLRHHKTSRPPRGHIQRRHGSYPLSRYSHFPANANRIAQRRAAFLCLQQVRIPRQVRPRFKKLLLVALFLKPHLFIPLRTNPAARSAPSAPSHRAFAINAQLVLAKQGVGLGVHRSSYPSTIDSSAAISAFTSTHSRVISSFALAICSRISHRRLYSRVVRASRVL